MHALKLQFILFGKVGINQFGKSINGFGLICTVSYQSNGRALYDAQRKNTEKRLGIHATLVLFNPDAAFELIGFLNKESRGSCVKTYLIVNHNFFGNHTCRSLFTVIYYFSDPNVANFTNKINCFYAFRQIIHSWKADRTGFYFSSTIVTPLSPSPKVPRRNDLTLLFLFSI